MGNCASGLALRPRIRYPHAAIPGGRTPRGSPRWERSPVKAYEAPDFRTLPQDVRRLFDTASDGFFNLPGWYDLVSRFSQRPDWRPKLVVNDAATAAFALQTNIRTGEAASLINPYTCAHDVIHGEDARAVRDLAHAFASAHPRPFRILLQGLDPESASFEAARSGLRDGGYRTKPFFCWGN